MSSIFPVHHAALLLGFAATALPAFSSPSQDAARITVLLYDYVNLHADMRSDAVSTAHRILSQAGVPTVFVPCHSQGTATGDAACTGSLGSSKVMLRIFQPWLAQDGKQVGYAIIAPKGSAYITVFVDPAVRRARLASLTEGCLLGHAIAHELGHLLLGAGAHSSTGIMRPAWRPGDEAWMASGAMRFGASEARKMRAALRIRTAEQAPAPSTRNQPSQESGCP